MFQPTLSSDQLRALAGSHLVAKIAQRYEPERRHANNPEAQAEAIAELTADVAELLPTKATLESVGQILDKAWRDLRRSYGYQTWPKTPLVLSHVSNAVDEAKRRAPQAEAPAGSRRPTLPPPETCAKKAAMWPDESHMRDYWTKLGNEAAIQWRIYLESGGRERDAAALSGMLNGRNE